ncbi:MAG: hypothetical protein ACJARO_002256 [Bacteriovoracaceae bacterium]|jgi:hypothetical protein
MFKGKSAPKEKTAMVREKPAVSKAFEISEERKVILLNFTGNVEVVKKGQRVPGARGMVLGFKDEIYTSRKSVAILSFANNSTIKIFSGSAFKITKIQSRERSDSNMQYNLFELKRGALLVDFINQGKSHFLEITSPVSKLQIRGTQFLYLHNEKKRRSQLAVREGIVKVFGANPKKSKFVLENQGTLVKGDGKLEEVIEDKWVEKINWSKLARGSGIDLYDPKASNLVKDKWKKDRASKQKYTMAQVSKNVGKAASKTKAGGMIKSVVGKVLEVGGAIAEKGVSTFKKANPVSKINEVGADVKNFEDEQKKKQALLDSLEEN